jgi:hypothetical protein
VAIAVGEEALATALTSIPMGAAILLAALLHELKFKDVGGRHAQAGEGFVQAGGKHWPPCDTPSAFEPKADVDGVVCRSSACRNGVMLGRSRYALPHEIGAKTAQGPHGVDRRVDIEMAIIQTDEVLVVSFC